MNTIVATLSVWIERNAHFVIQLVGTKADFVQMGFPEDVLCFEIKQRPNYYTLILVFDGQHYAQIFQNFGSTSMRMHISIDCLREVSIPYNFINILQFLHEDCTSAWPKEPSSDEPTAEERGKVLSLFEARLKNSTEDLEN